MDQGALAVSVRKALDIPPNDLARFRPAAQAALTLVVDFLADRTTPTSPPVFLDLLVQVRATNTALGSGVTPALPESWRLDAGSIPAVSLPLQAHVDSACALQGVACTTAFETVREVLRIARLTRLALVRSETPDMRALLAENLRREQSWEDYFERARSQYFWELALNSLLMKETRPLLPSGQRGGFRAVPTSQVLFLHPYVALEYASSEAEGNRLNPLLILDVVGYNKWSWNADGPWGSRWVHRSSCLRPTT
jgi:hypothetical protein